MSSGFDDETSGEHLEKSNDDWAPRVLRFTWQAHRSRPLLLPARAIEHCPSLAGWLRETGVLGPARDRGVAMKETLALIEKTAILKSAPLFSNLPTEAVAEVAARASEHHFDLGKTIFKEGEANRGAFMIVEGRVEIYKGRALDSIRLAGDGFGELSLREGEPHQFTAIASSTRTC
jgi:hypothetical protein